MATNLFSDLGSDLLRCSYQSKHCENIRAMKQSGELHKLCEFHRKKANLNQMRMQQRRRMKRKQSMTPYSHLGLREKHTVEPIEPLDGPQIGISEEDLQVLIGILFDASDVDVAGNLLESEEVLPQRFIAC